MVGSSVSILVANSKGGSGKTTVATNLAAAYANGGMRVALADLDRQHSALRWLKRRPADRPPILPLDWSRGVDGNLPDIDRLIIDAPAAMRRGDVALLLPRVDLVIVPVQPSAFDLAATARFVGKLRALKPIRKGKVDIAMVGNRLRTRARAGQQLEEALARRDLGLAARIADAAIYAECAEAGTGLFDLGTRRARNLRDAWRGLLDLAEQAAP